MAAMIRLHNTLSGRVEEFVPIESGSVKLYTCGPTVYDFPHIGNWRSYVFEDLLKRLFLYRGFKVLHVMNITDVDDKTIRGANAKGVGLEDYTKPFIEAFARDRDILAILPADVYPRATAHIEEMVGLIEILLEKGFAYQKDGSIYFAIDKFPAYGRLSKINLEDLRPGQPRRRRRIREGERPRLRPLEGAEGRRARLGDPDRSGPAGLAHRMLGHELQVPRPDLRHPLRGRRQHLPPSRERDRPVRGGQRRQVRQLLAPRPSSRRRRREDVQVERQLLHADGHPETRIRSPRRPLPAPLHPLPEDAQLHLRGPGPSPDRPPADREFPGRAPGCDER